MHRRLLIVVHYLCPAVSTVAENELTAANMARAFFRRDVLSAPLNRNRHSPSCPHSLPENQGKATPVAVISFRHNTICLNTSCTPVSGATGEVVSVTSSLTSVDTEILLFRHGFSVASKLCRLSLHLCVRGINSKPPVQAGKGEYPWEVPTGADARVRSFFSVTSGQTGRTGPVCYVRPLPCSDINPVARVVGSADTHSDIHTLACSVFTVSVFGDQLSVTREASRLCFWTNPVWSFSSYSRTPARQLHIRAGMTADITIKGAFMISSVVFPFRTALPLNTLGLHPSPPLMCLLPA